MNFEDSIDLVVSGLSPQNRKESIRTVLLEYSNEQLDIDQCVNLLANLDEFGRVVMPDGSLVGLEDLLDSTEAIGE